MSDSRKQGRSLEEIIRSSNPDDLDRAAKRREKKDQAIKLLEGNRRLLQKAKDAPMFAKAAHIEQLADKTQELHELLIELI